jgi:hypothetical protein
MLGIRNDQQQDTPMFVVFTADDAIQSYTINAVNQFLAQRKNPNGCAPKMTYYTSLNYTNYTMVTGKHRACAPLSVSGKQSWLIFQIIPFSSAPSFVLAFSFVIPPWLRRMPRLVCRWK